MSTIVSRRVKLLGATAALAVLLSGCAALPTSGPTESQIRRGIEPDRTPLGIKLIDIDAAAVVSANQAAHDNDSHNATLATLGGQGANDLIGPGDVLAVNVYEVGVGLFGGQRAVTDVYDPSAHSEIFPKVTVDRNGTIQLPYIGPLQVAGRTTTEIQGMIERSYRGKSQNPQVMVEREINLSQAVYVTGDARKPGRIELSLQRERLLDAVATAGGAVNQTQDMLVRFTRGGRTIAERLDRIVPGAPDDLVLISGDRIELLREPQTFVTFGAAGKIEQVSFDQVNLTLAEAVARSGGPNDGTANPKAIFLFRYVDSLDGKTSTPTIYRLNMMRPDNYFLAQRFAMHDKDVVYISNASINRLGKFVSILTTLFTPAATARVLAR